MDGELIITASDDKLEIGLNYTELEIKKLAIDEQAAGNEQLKFNIDELSVEDQVTFLKTFFFTPHTYIVTDKFDDIPEENVT